MAPVLHDGELYLYLLRQIGLSPVRRGQELWWVMGPDWYCTVMKVLSPYGSPVLEQRFSDPGAGDFLLGIPVICGPQYGMPVLTAGPAVAPHEGQLTLRVRVLEPRELA